MKSITEKQSRILSLHDAGLPVEQIAKQLALSETSIRLQLARIAKKARLGRIELQPLPIEMAC